MASTLPDDLDATGLPDAGSDGGEYDWSPEAILASARAAGGSAMSAAANLLSAIQRAAAAVENEPLTPPPPPSGGEATRWGAQTHGCAGMRARARNTREEPPPC